MRSELGLPISVGVARTKHLAKIASQVAKPDGLSFVEPGREAEFLRDLPADLIWGVGPVAKGRLAEAGVFTIGQLAESRLQPLTDLLGRAVGAKVGALARNEDRRKIQTRRRARSVGAQSSLGRKPALEHVFVPTMRHLADRVAARLRAKSCGGRTVTVRVRFRDLRSTTRSVTLPAPISATASLAEVCEDLVRAALKQNDREREISLLGVSVSRLEKIGQLQLELPLDLNDDPRRPGAKSGAARLSADRAVDAIRERFGRQAIGYGSIALAPTGSVPDAFRELAEKDFDQLQS